MYKCGCINKYNMCKYHNKIVCNKIADLIAKQLLKKCFKELEIEEIPDKTRPIIKPEYYREV